MFSLITILFIFVSITSAEQQFKHDGMCPIIEDTLCVKEMLIAIANVARSINRTANEIERYIRTRLPTGSLDLFINYEKRNIKGLPIAHHHGKFFQLNNINKKYLGDMLLEAHNALSCYYKSINRILDAKDALSSTTDAWLKQIQHMLRYEMICRYRNVLSVYSHIWPFINDINELQFTRENYRSSPSMVHDVHVMVVIGSLRDWMRNIHAVMTNMERKYYSTTMKILK